MFDSVVSLTSLVIDNEADQIIRESYSLTCRVAGAENLHSTISYKWTENTGTTNQTQVGTNSNILSFSPLRLSDAANYTCRAAIDSSFLSRFSISSTTTYDVKVQSELIVAADVLVSYLH